MSPKPQQYDVGDYWTPEATFTVDGVDTNPTTITVLQEDPDELEATIVDNVVPGSLSPSSVPVAKTGTGIFKVNPGVLLTKPGLYTVKFKGSGAAAATVAHYAFAVADPIDVEVQTYVQAEELKKTLELGGTQFADIDIQTAVAAASRAVDTALGRRFYLDVDDTQERYFTADSTRTVRVDDLVELGSVLVDYDGDGVFETTWTQGVDFLLEPRNAPAEGRPYTRLRLLRLRSGYTRRRYEIKVTGQFGWADPPDAIRALTSLVATRLLRRLREAPFGVVALGVDGAAVRALPFTRDPEFELLAAPYRHRKVLV